MVLLPYVSLFSRTLIAIMVSLITLTFLILSEYLSVTSPLLVISFISTFRGLANFTGFIAGAVLFFCWTESVVTLSGLTVGVSEIVMFYTNGTNTGKTGTV